MKLILSIIFTSLFCGLLWMGAPQVKARPDQLRAQAAPATEPARPWTMTVGTGWNPFVIEVSQPAAEASRRVPQP